MRVYYESFGCDIEREEFIRFLKLSNLTETKEMEEADIIIIHLCALSSDSFRAIGLNMMVLKHFKKINQRIGKEIKIFVGGCAEQLLDIKKFYPFVDGVFRRGKLVEDLSKIFNYNAQIDCGTIHYKNSVVIQKGCSRKEKCGFCIKSYVITMPSHSKPVEKIVADIKATVAAGYHDIALLAENSTEYYDPITDSRLLDLIKIVEKIDGVNFIDLTGLCIDELEENPELVDYIAASEKIRKVQLEIQSLIPVVRHNMRLSSRAGFVYKLLEKFTNKYICTNIMVGYPGEEEESFKNQLDPILRKLLYYIEVNKYDDTPGVYAHKLPQIPKTVVDDRIEMMKNTIRKTREEVANKILNTSSKNGGIECVYVGHDIAEALHYTAIVEVDNLPTNLINGQKIWVEITTIEDLFRETGINQELILRGSFVK